MTTRTKTLALLTAAAVVITACGPRDPDLLTFRRSGEGPDEFTVAPS